MFLLDTNACIRLINNSSARLASRFRGHNPIEFRLCSVVKAELYHGARKSSRTAENIRLINRFLEPFVSLPFDDLCAEEYGLIRAELERVGTPIGPNDLMIAAIARAYDLTLVTNNVSEFSRVIGLQVEDWESGR